MADERLERLAETLVDYSLAVQPEQLVVLQGGLEAEPLLTEVYRRVLRAGGNPLLRLALPRTQEIFYRDANEQQLTRITPFDRLVPEQADASLVIISDTNTRNLAGADPAKQQLAQSARRELTQTYMARSASGELRWCVTLFPTNAHAQDADMSLDAFTDFVYAACHVDEPDPVAYWRGVGAEQQRLIDWLAPKREAHITGPDTDLRLGIAGRTFINADGRYNFPDGEIFTGPEEQAVDGTIRFSFPSIVQGREVEDIRLWFEGGRVVKATAGKNQEYLEAMLDADEGARRLGEFAFGTNFGIQQFTRNILFDEKIGGTVHLALGAGYPESGSRNQSAIHWDMICDLRQGGEVTVDGEPFLKDGAYLV
jgi:aminopeptidase